MAEATLQLKHIAVRGVVQGVGFRPFVYRLAREHGLTGWVLNHSGGVEIEVEGPPGRLDAFVCELTAQAPPLARIVGIEVTEAPPDGHTQFEIRHSVAEEGHYQLISPDIATCPDCLHELLEPGDRRYRYPFTNCTNCGPRFTIIRDIPYDRPLTTMEPFVMCPECQGEYDNPLNRRFHAQPNACPVCGPHTWLELSAIGSTARQSPVATGDEAMRLASQMLIEGRVLAIKGLGGFHLACDATSRAAVHTLRERKGRPAKPLAVMMASMSEVRRHCHVSEQEEQLLTSQQCPIVLLRWRDDSSIVREVAPENLYLGVMLPYTPLHHILLRDVGRPLVMTSGNLSEEPIAQDNKEARRRLGHLADAFLLHNREIYARYDDSVWFCPDPHLAIPFDQRPTSTHLDLGAQAQIDKLTSPGEKLGHLSDLVRPQPIRRSRGYAPFPVRLPFQTRQILAVGAELKNTFCVTRDGFAFLSQHIGDMENLETLEHFEATVTLYQHLFRIEPELITYDLHPDYSATQYAASARTERLVGVQHHQAHIAACLADNGWSPDQGPVIGVAWDGTGYGLDGKIWGGEFLVGSYAGLRRVAHLEYLPLPGGDAAIRNPWRLALGYVYALTGEPPPLPGIGDQEQKIVCQQVDSQLNVPLTSAAGRLFDAVAALLGIRQRVTYEAQAAIELEMLATQWASPTPTDIEVLVYPFGIECGDGGTIIRLDRLIRALQADLKEGMRPAEISWRFHLTMAKLISDVCLRIGEDTALRTVALSGGCFQNRLLLAWTVQSLVRNGFRVLLHHQVPCNDGGLSLGQAALAQFAPPQWSEAHEIH